MPSAVSSPIARRLAGIVLPVTALRTDSDWGVGELLDLEGLAPMLERAEARVVSVLPLLEPTPGQESPYSPLSAFAIDPILLRLEAVEEFADLGGRGALSSEDRAMLAEARGSFPVRAPLVRGLKERWLRACWVRFREEADVERRSAFASFRAAQRSWLDEYALFRALRAAHPTGWRGWPAPLRDRDPVALKEATRTYADAIGYRAYLQWLASQQLQRAAEALRERGILLGGDEPFLTAEDSVDVWAHPDRYRFDATVGAPPDAFSDDGQDWGLPPYDWDRLAAEAYAPFRARARRAAEAFDLVRVDHVVGLYRTYTRPIDRTKKPFFAPAKEAAQRAQGEAVLAAMAAEGIALTAEDLGDVPDFVRTSLLEQGIYGFKVLRWEVRDGAVDPADWPPATIATTGTHDTDTLSAWWDTLPPEGREPFLGLPSLAAVSPDRCAGFTPDVHRGLLTAVYASPSNLALIPIQDAFGLRGRINVPNSVGAHNWSWRMPWSLETMSREAHIGAALDLLATLARRHGRARV